MSTETKKEDTLSGALGISEERYKHLVKLIASYMKSESHIDAILKSALEKYLLNEDDDINSIIELLFFSYCIGKANSEAHGASQLIESFMNDFIKDMIRKSK